MVSDGVQPAAQRQSYAKAKLCRENGGNILESNNVVTGLDGGHTLADRLDNTGTLVAQDDRESTLRVLTGESVGI